MILQSRIHAIACLSLQIDNFDLLALTPPQRAFLRKRRFLLEQRAVGAFFLAGTHNNGLRNGTDERQTEFGKEEIIFLAGKPIGRFYVDHRKDEIRIIDIALFAEYRNQGIGTALLDNVLLKGEQAGLPVPIHVEQFNPAMRLYHRLGFRQIDEHGLYDLLEWLPWSSHKSSLNTRKI